MSRAVVGLPLFAAVAVLSAAALPALPAQAAESAATAAIRAEVAAMKADYEARIAALETRVAAAEARAAAVPAETDLAQAGPADVAEPVELADAGDEEQPAVNSTPSANALNPGVSVVLNGNYFVSSEDPSMARIPGFERGGESGPPPRGFSLAESEFNLTASVDPYLSASLTVAFDGEGAAEVEEAYAQTTSLPNGLTLKGGRFFSGIGYLNERHAHTWTFIDTPLPYRAFLGNQYGDDGVQVRWLAPTEIFLEFGAEWFRGDSFPAGNGANSGAGTQTAFVHAGGDFDQSSSWLAAASYIRAKADARETEDPVFGVDVFSGDTELGIVSGIYKWAPGGNGIRRSLAISGEYFFGTERGQFNGVPFEVDRTGWYAQGVYKFRPRWSFGLRYSALDAGDVGPPLAGTTLDDMGMRSWAASALLEYDSSEFGRFRLQYTRDESDLGAADQLLLQYTVVYGAHGAHRY
jgi:hypothetical protein